MYSFGLEIFCILPNLFCLCVFIFGFHFWFSSSSLPLVAPLTVVTITSFICLQEVPHHLIDILHPCEGMSHVGQLMSAKHLNTCNRIQ